MDREGQLTGSRNAAGEMPAAFAFGDPDIQLKSWNAYFNAAISA
jgi:hypothetical protein